MATPHEIFILAIRERKQVKILFDSKEKGIIERSCIPFDFGLSRKYKDGLDRFHFYDLDSPDSKHNLSILPEQLHCLEIMEIPFEPKDYVNWTPNWIVVRDWGLYS
jgi:hypothetical protein